MQPSIVVVEDSTQQIVLRDVINERRKQECKWGEQNHDPVVWLAILMEEVGETATEILEERFHYTPERLEKMREELVQVAAVAVSFLECLDRGKWQHLKE